MSYASREQVMISARVQAPQVATTTITTIKISAVDQTCSLTAGGGSLADAVRAIKQRKNT